MTRTVVPHPGLESASIRPPAARTNRRHVNTPNPAHPRWVSARSGSTPKTPDRGSPRHPDPVSMTSKVKVFHMEHPQGQSTPLPNIAFRAFKIRLRSTCWSTTGPGPPPPRPGAQHRSGPPPTPAQGTPRPRPNTRSHPRTALADSSIAPNPSPPTRSAPPSPLHRPVPALTDHLRVVRGRQSQLAVAHHRRQNIVELVGDDSQQRAQGGEPVRVVHVARSRSRSACTCCRDLTDSSVVGFASSRRRAIDGSGGHFADSHDIGPRSFSQAKSHV